MGAALGFAASGGERRRHAAKTAQMATTAMAAALTMRSPALAGGVAGRCLFLDVTMRGMAVGNYIIFAGG
jgi:hypothetical protein